MLKLKKLFLLLSMQIGIINNHMFFIIPEFTIYCNLYLQGIRVIQNNIKNFDNV